MSIFDNVVVPATRFKTIARYSGSLPQFHGIVRATYSWTDDEGNGRWVCTPARTGVWDERLTDGRLTGVREKSLAPVLVVDRWSSCCSLCGTYDMYATDDGAEELRKRLLQGSRSECAEHGAFAFAASPYGETLLGGREYERLPVITRPISVGRRW